MGLLTWVPSAGLSPPKMGRNEPEAWMTDQALLLRTFRSGYRYSEGILKSCPLNLGVRPKILGDGQRQLSTQQHYDRNLLCRADLGREAL